VEANQSIEEWKKWIMKTARSLVQVAFRESSGKISKKKIAAIVSTVVILFFVSIRTEQGGSLWWNSLTHDGFVTIFLYEALFAFGALSVWKLIWKLPRKMRMTRRQPKSP
jgi:hypothetical protein